MPSAPLAVIDLISAFGARFKNAGPSSPASFADWRERPMPSKITQMMIITPIVPVRSFSERICFGVKGPSDSSSGFCTSFCDDLSLLLFSMEQQDPIEILAGPEDEGTRLDRFLAASAEIDLSRTRIKALIQDGQLSCNGQCVSDPSASVRAGQLFSLTMPEIEDATPQAENIPLDIYFEDEHLIVLEKPAGMVVHPAPGSYEGTLVNALLYHCGDSLSGIGGVARPGIVHRLDKDTSGVMMAAKSEKAHQKLSKMFAKHALTRRYHALVWGMPALREGTIDAPIGRSRYDRKKMAVMENGKEAITHYTTLRDLPPFSSLVECTLETGRTHQIRVHLSEMGYGIIGDGVYGHPPRSAQMPDALSRDILAGLRGFERQALHAAHLGFLHPITKQEMSFDSPLPDDMLSLIGQIEDGIARRAKGIQ